VDTSDNTIFLQHHIQAIINRFKEKKTEGLILLPVISIANI